MFSIHLDPTYLILAALAALLFDLYGSWLLHARYGRQFGWGFVLSGMVSFSLPALLAIGLPVYLILASGLTLGDRLIMLAAMGLCCLWAGWRLRHRILSRVFTLRDVQNTQAKAQQQRLEDKQQAQLEQDAEQA